MYDYLALGKNVLTNGYTHPDRTGVGRCSLFSQCLRFDLTKGFPLVTTRQIDFNAMVEETLWFIRGSNDAKELQAKKVKFWDHWAVKEPHIDSFIRQYILPFFGHQIDEETITSTCKQRLTEYIGRIGPLYGPAWRQLPVSEMIARLNGFLPSVKEDHLASDKKTRWLKDYENDQHLPETPPCAEYLNQRAHQEIDQLHNLIEGLKHRPWSSRHVISAWIPEYMPIEDVAPAHNVLLGRAALAPCHVYQQYLVSPGETKDAPLRLSLHLTQRSSDIPIGLPVNIAQYALLLSMIAQCVDMVPHEFHWCGVDVHVYSNQIDKFSEQLARTPYALPRLVLNPAIKDIFSFTAEDIRLDGYQSHPSITYPIAV